LAYASGLLDDLPGGLAAPRCLGVTERPGPGVWLWLEEITDAAGAWPLARFAAAARRLGAFNGAYLTGRPLPDTPWLSRRWLRGWVDVALGPFLDQLDRAGAWEHPILLLACPPPLPDRLRRLWAGREALLGAIERLPATLGHLDAFRSNLLTRQRPDGREETVALDWAFVGRAAVGEELGALVAASLLRGDVALDEAGALEEAALDGYLAGLREAGWSGSPQAARLGYAAAVALRYGHMALFDIARTFFQPDHAAALEREEGRPFAEIAATRAALASFLLDRADGARALLDAA
jgi:hypothetical protein